MSIARDLDRNIHNLGYENAQVDSGQCHHSELPLFSFCQGYERPGAYIATQGPKPETIFDFWRMLWEKRAARIVMLTNLVEGDKKKCDLYWPEDKPLRLLGLTVHKESERVSNDYTIRTFSMARDGERRTVSEPGDGVRSG